VDRAVHRAVCEATGSDGAFCCTWYALAGALACSKATGSRYIPQVGGCDIVFDPGPPARSNYICGEGNGFARGEFHAWVVRPGEVDPGTGVGAALEWVDFSARHYPRHLDLPTTADVVVTRRESFTVLRVAPERWSAPPPPDYVWHAGSEPPPGVSFYADAASCRAFAELVDRGLATADRVMRLAARYLREELSAAREPAGEGAVTR